MKRVLCMIALLWASACWGQQRGGGVFSLADGRDPVASLAGQWRFQPGDDPRWATAAFDDSQWALVRSDKPWGSIGYPGLSGLAWYRFKVELPAATMRLGLYLPVIETDYQVFEDGVLLKTVGRMPPKGLLYVPVQEVVPLLENERGGRVATFAIRVWHDPEWSGYMPGGMQGRASIGSLEIFEGRRAMRQASAAWQNSMELNLGVLQLLAGVIAAALYLLRRSEREYLWFSVMVWGGGVAYLVAYWSRLHGSSPDVTEGTEYLFHGVALAASLLFYQRLLRGWMGVGFRIAMVCAALWTANCLLLTLHLSSARVENLGEVLLVLPVYGWVVWLLLRKAWDGVEDAGLLLTPVLVLYTTLVYTETVFTLDVFEVSERFLPQPYVPGAPLTLQFKDLALVFYLLAMLVILVNRFARTRREQDRIAGELEQARVLQHVLIPEVIPAMAGLRFEAAYLPAQEVGGDFFQIVPLEGGETLVVLGDVAGKGLVAAMTVSLVVGAVRTLAECSPSPGEVLAGLNRRLFGRGAGFTTCLAMRFSGKQVTLACAGHLSPYLNGHEVELQATLPLGLVEGAEFLERAVALNTGDHLTMVTDGVPEAMHKRELLGFARAAELSVRRAGEIAELARLFGQTDDITVLTVDVE